MIVTSHQGGSESALDLGRLGDENRARTISLGMSEAGLTDPSAGQQAPWGSVSYRESPCPAVSSAGESCTGAGGAGSSQRRNTDGFSEASSAANSSAGARWPRTCLGRLLSSFSTASRYSGWWALRSVPLGK